MKRFIILLGCLIFFICGCDSNDASMEVVNYFNKYSNFTSDVQSDLVSVSENLNLSFELQKMYYDVYKRQYENLTYEILSEKYDGKSATVLVRISVYDYGSIDRISNEYLKLYPDEFITNNSYDFNKFIEYKLNLMMDQSKRISYDLEVHLIKSNRKWMLEKLNNDALNKINGVFIQ